MEITFKFNNQCYSLNLKNNIIFFGQDSLYKRSFIKGLFNEIINKSNNVMVNGNRINNNDLNVIFIDEESDFINQFKFSKNNYLKQIIYSDIITKINETKIINYTNEIFDVIDNKVNSLLNKKINKVSEDNISFNIEIPDVNSVIDKFTNIYIDNILINSEQITKSMKKKLLYKLYFTEFKKSNNVVNIVFIDNFDAYLSSNEIIELLSEINKLSNFNCHFILSSTSNIFEYISLDLFQIYKLSNNLFPFENIEKAIKIYLLKKEYNSITEISFDNFYNNNEYLIMDEEIFKIKEDICNKHPDFIGKVLNSDNINFITSKPKNITNDYFICHDKKNIQLFTEIFKTFMLNIS